MNIIRCVCFIGALGVGFFSCGMFDKRKINKKEKDFELYQERYNFLFRRCPVEYQTLLFKILYEPNKTIETGNGTYDYLKEFIPAIKKSIEYFENGGTSEDFEQKYKQTLKNRDFNLKNMRSDLSSMLITLVGREEDFDNYFYEKSNYFQKNLISNGKIVMSGTRGDSSKEKEKITIRRLSEIKTGVDDFKRRLVGHYKIHLMPFEEDILKVTQMLLKALKKDKELGSLISKFKVKTDLSLEYQAQDKNSPYALIVIYPAEGKDKVQKLLDKLLTLFKDVKGIDKTPRYNVKVNDLIFYAQGDADDKRPDKKNNESKYLKYFDEKKNYALYKDDFEDQDHESYELKF